MNIFHKMFSLFITERQWVPLRHVGCCYLYSHLQSIWITLVCGRHCVCHCSHYEFEEGIRMRCSRRETHLLRMQVRDYFVASNQVGNPPEFSSVGSV